MQRTDGCDNSDMELLLASVASAFAGCIDAIVGGGGLILVPALFALFPTTHPATLFGTNKAAAVWGTGIATVQYSRRVVLPWYALGPAAVVAAAGSLAEPLAGRTAIHDPTPHAPGHQSHPLVGKP